MTDKNNGETFQELFDFYHKEYKPLYCYATADNALTQEVLFEIAAAFDHVARYYATDADPKRSESYCTGKALSHMKRACLDLYKLKLNETRQIYEDLCKLPINIIDNGKFEENLRRLFAETKEMAARARKLESTNIPLAFDIWQKVYTNCLRVTSEEFYLHPNVNWAKRTEQKIIAKVIEGTTAD